MRNKAASDVLLLNSEQREGSLVSAGITDGPGHEETRIRAVRRKDFEPSMLRIAVGKAALTARVEKTFLRFAEHFPKVLSEFGNFVQAVFCRVP